MTVQFSSILEQKPDCTYFKEQIKKKLTMTNTLHISEKEFKLNGWYSYIHQWDFNNFLKPYGLNLRQSKYYGIRTVYGDSKEEILSQTPDHTLNQSLMVPIYDISKNIVAFEKISSNFPFSTSVVKTYNFLAEERDVISCNQEEVSDWSKVVFVEGIIPSLSLNKKLKLVTFGCTGQSFLSCPLHLQQTLGGFGEKYGKSMDCIIVPQAIINENDFLYDSYIRLHAILEQCFNNVRFAFWGQTLWTTRANNTFLRGSSSIKPTIDYLTDNELSSNIEYLTLEEYRKAVKCDCDNRKEYFDMFMER